MNNLDMIEIDALRTRYHFFLRSARVMRRSGWMRCFVPGAIARARYAYLMLKIYGVSP